MSLLLVPHEVGLDRVELWVGALDEPDIDPAALSVGLAIPAAPAPTPIGAWDGIVSAGRRSIRFRRLVIDGLLPRGRYRFELRLDGRVVSDAVATTLPERLPSLDERPFTIMLGSCFARAADGAGNAGRAYAQLPADVQPDIKILCGDQVYLDQPTPEFLVHTHTLDGLRERHLANYASAWDQTGGFRELLRAGGTYFSSDDHDFWNNAPNATVIARDTWSQDGRANWRDAARTMYDAFQRPIDRAPTTFTVGDLSVFVADTRLDRTEGTDAFATDAQLSAIETWIHGLERTRLPRGRPARVLRPGGLEGSLDGLRAGRLRVVPPARRGAAVRPAFGRDPHRRRAFRPGRGLVPRATWRHRRSRG